MNHWLKELERAEKEQSDYLKRGKMVVKRYSDERKKDDKRTKFNILWSNTETLRPALISATPRPECRPRYRKKDPVVRVAAKTLERAIEFSVDQYDFIRFGKKVVQDYLLPGRGVARVRYIPTMEKKEDKIPLKMKEGPDFEPMWVKDGSDKAEEEFEIDDEGNPYVMGEVEEVVFEEVRAERVPWQWFRMEPATTWDQVNWVAFGAPYTMGDGIRKWGKKFASASLTTDETGDEAGKDKVIVWEIWDKRSRKQIFVAEGCEEYLEKNDDPLGLERFFPMPEPIYAVENNDTMVPTPEFILWQDQADELDLLSERIRKVTEAIKARGAYAGAEQTNLSNILESDDNTLVPIDDWSAFIDKGGLDGIISWIPIEIFAKVLQILETQRSVKIQEIYELTGVSDIQRGSSDPRETAKAQQLKANFGNRRLATKQDETQRFFRDIYRIKAEIIAEQFDPETLKLMVGLESENELFDEAIKLIKSDVGRAFNVDVETDSTIALDEEAEKQGLAEAMQAVSAFLGGILPLVQVGAIPNQVAFEILRDYFRKYRFGRKLDELLDEFQQNQPEDPNAKKQKQEQDAQAAAQKAEQERMAAEMKMAQEKHAMEMDALQKKSAAELEKQKQELAIKAEEKQMELRQDEQEHEQEMRQDAEMHRQKVENLKEMGRAQAEVKRQMPKESTGEQG